MIPGRKTNVHRGIRAAIQQGNRLLLRLTAACRPAPAAVPLLYQKRQNSQVHRLLHVHHLYLLGKIGVG